MRLSFSWLKEFLEVSLPPEALAERLTLAGIEVTSLSRVEGLPTQGAARQAGLLALRATGQAGDWLLEMEVTPNRPDLLSHLGIARETAALLKRRFHFPRWLRKELSPLAALPSPVSVSIEDAQGCRRYIGLVIEGVEVVSSPASVVKRLSTLGIRSVNNVVDATNLCLMELGQPLHAFDLDRLEGQEIRVRRAAPQETFVTIDGISRKLTSEHLVIADASGPVALAGIMGGKETEIRPSTRRVFLESALFDPIRIRRGVKGLGVSSDSSYRFERGVDAQMVMPAAFRAARLICHLAGGKVTGGPLEAGGISVTRRSIRLRSREVSEVLGVKLSLKQQSRFLISLGCAVSGNSFGLKVEPPSFREDLKGPEDLLEELARLVGYDRCPATRAALPRHPVEFSKEPPESTSFFREREIRRTLAAAGLQEIMTYSLVSPEAYATIGLDAKEALFLSNPIALPHSVLRKTLLLGALETLSRNLNRKSDFSFALFEVGKVYGSSLPNHPLETLRMGLLAAGTTAPPWGVKPVPLGLFHVKGTIEFLCGHLRIGSLTEKRGAASPYFGDEALTFFLGGELLGEAGLLRKEVRTAFDLPEDLEVAYAELDLERMVLVEPQALRVRPLPKIPPVIRDLAILVPDEISHEKVLRVILEGGRPLLTGVSLFDLYKGKQIPDEKKSLAFRLEFSSGDKTLTEEEIIASYLQIVGRLEKEVRAILR